MPEYVVRRVPGENTTRVSRPGGVSRVRTRLAGGGGGGGVTDHGLLTGLTDDDHTQYALADGSRGTFATAAQGALADSATQPGDLAAVATTGAYADLSGTPTLGTAAAAATTDFATAAQGTDARTPTAHATSHENGGADELALDASQLTGGTVATARLGSGTADATTFLRGDQTWATPAGGGALTHISTLGAQTAVTESATDFATLGVNAVLLDTAVTLPISAAGDVFEFTAAITFTNSAGATRQARPGFRLGSTNVTVGSNVPLGAIGNGLTCSVMVRGTIHVLTTGTQRLIVSTAGDGTNVSAQAASTAATEDFTGTLPLQVTFGTNNASGTQTAQLQSLHVTKVEA